MPLTRKNAVWRYSSNATRSGHSRRFPENSKCHNQNLAKVFISALIGFARPRDMTVSCGHASFSSMVAIYLLDGGKSLGADFHSFFRRHLDWQRKPLVRTIQAPQIRIGTRRCLRKSFLPFTSGRLRQCWNRTLPEQQLRIFRVKNRKKNQNGSPTGSGRTSRRLS